jgi:flagellar basal body P-ring formation protein FlgA
MFRNSLAALMMLLASSGAFAAESELTGKSLVTGNVVTVGDIFTNSGRHDDHVLAPAPDVGAKLILGKTDLVRVAKAFNLEWQPADDAQVSIERDAVAVTADDIVQALQKSDLQDKISGDASFEISNIAKPIVLDGQDIPELLISDTSFDPATEKFAATLIIAREGTTIKDIRLYGLATPMATVPVLRAPIQTNAIISKNDIIERTVAKRNLRGAVVLSKDDLVGMTAKRTLIANAPIKQADVTPPVMIKRNELVTVIYQNGPISLSTKARALSNGSKGDSITLMNVNSKKPFDALVTGPQQAVVDLSAING